MRFAHFFVNSRSEFEVRVLSHGVRLAQLTQPIWVVFYDHFIISKHFASILITWNGPL